MCSAPPVRKLPFGVGQVGKSFRNEITPGNFIFRVREFEQMELEFFCKPGTDLEWFDYWRSFCHNWLLCLEYEGRRTCACVTTIRRSCASTPRPPRTLSTASPSAGASCGAWPDRTDYDLTQHQKTSGKNMDILRPGRPNEKYMPYVIEPSLGVERCVLAFLVRRL